MFPLPVDSQLAGTGHFLSPDAGDEPELRRDETREVVNGTAAAYGLVTHVYVDRETQKKTVEVPEKLRRLAEGRLMVPDGEETGRSWRREEGAKL